MQESLVAKFAVGKKYSREQVADAIALPPDLRGGAWQTGYRRWRSEFFVFCNIGVPGRTGHDYRNRWSGKNLIWYGKTRSRIGQPEIDEMLSGRLAVHVFWRAKDRALFTYAGIAHAYEVVGGSPVEVVWAFDSESFGAASSSESTPTRPTWRRGPRPSTGRFNVVREDGPTQVYLMKLCGPIQSILPSAAPGSHVLKVGMSQDPTRRSAELNSGFPPGSEIAWVLMQTRQFDNSADAFAAESRWLEHLREKELWIGGEFALATESDLKILIATD
jgi:hypothetical protein